MERKCGHSQCWGFWSRTTISWHLQFTVYGFLVHSLSFVFTEDAQEITFHFLSTSVFHFSSKYGKTEANNFEIARAHLFREFKSSKGNRQLNCRAWPLCFSLGCHLYRSVTCAGALCSAGVTLSSENGRLQVHCLPFCFFPAVDLCCICIKLFFSLFESSTLSFLSWRKRKVRLTSLLK